MVDNLCHEEFERERTKKLDQVIDPMSEAVNHPSHYGGEENPYEAIKVIEAWSLGFCDGNVVKYLCRWRTKGGIADLEKASWYLARFIEQEKRKVVR